VGIGARLKQLFTGGERGEAFFEELEDLLIEADVGAGVTMDIVGELRRAGKRFDSREELTEALRSLIRERVQGTELEIPKDELSVILVLGVNGTGKTTTCAKLAHYYRENASIARPVLAAGDTFRAAAIEQLGIHAERLGARFVQQAHGADPGAVIYDAIESAAARGEQLVIADTAGRMHTKSHLMQQLQKIDRIVGRSVPAGRYKKLLVLDSTTGQNALRQAEMFHEVASIDGVVLAKYDSTAKGGIAVSVCGNLELPIAFVGTGERYEDLQVFRPDDYVRRLLESGGE